MDIIQAKEAVIKAGKKLVESGLIARTWGNVSCRVDDDSFVITPSGREYLSLTVDEIVQVKIADLSHTGDVKPSSEKKVHAAAYEIFPEVNFVIHTHQENASVLGSTGLDSIVMDSHPLLGGEVYCAKYALPGTNSLRKNVEAALRKSEGQAIIMKNHGALCFGKDAEETFTVALELETFCHDFLVHHYLEISERESYDRLEMSEFALLQNKSINSGQFDRNTIEFLQSKRENNGFTLYNDETEMNLMNKQIDSTLPPEAKIYEEIYEKHKDINHIIVNHSPEALAISRSGIELRPLLDDFAQLAGTKARNVDPNPLKIAKALKRSSVVFVKNVGALCCGKTKEDALAVKMVTQKASKAFIGALLFAENGKIKPINSFESMLMRFVYLKSYSKQAESSD